MGKKRLRLGILFGGKSAEHEVSLVSARSVIEKLDPEKYEVTLIGIDKQGQWHVRDPAGYLTQGNQPGQIALAEGKEPFALAPAEACVDHPAQLDVVFPILHGPYGEDGSVQGFLKLANIPFVGADILGSAIGMDKEVSKRLLRDAGIPIAKFIVVHRHEKDAWSFERVSQEFPPPFFIKPSGLGSSVGISKVSSASMFESALEEAFLYDKKVLIEEFIPGRELVCSILGNEHPIASLPGEIVPHHEFYSYEAKYLDNNGATYHIPANVSTECVERIQKMAIDAYRTLCCEGMARIDFFLTKDDRLFVNELNSIPGFTHISTYPKLWAVSGLPYSELLDRLIELAIARHESHNKLRSSFQS